MVPILLDSCDSYYLPPHFRPSLYTPSPSPPFIVVIFPPFLSLILFLQFLSFSCFYPENFGISFSIQKFIHFLCLKSKSFLRLNFNLGNPMFTSSPLPSSISSQFRSSPLFTELSQLAVLIFIVMPIGWSVLIRITAMMLIMSWFWTGHWALL